MVGVIYLHKSWLNDGTLSSIAVDLCCSAVPLFYMVNGELLLRKKKDYSLKAHFKKVIHLIIVMSIWRLLYAIGAILLSWGDFSTVGFGEWIGYFFGISIDGIPTAHFWFMEELISIYILLPVIWCIRKYDEKLLTYIFLIVCFFSVGITELNFWSSYRNYKISFDQLRTTYEPFGYNISRVLVFFLLGYLLSEWIKKKKDCYSKFHLRLISAAMMLFGILGLELIRYLEFGGLKYNFQVITNRYQKLFLVVLSIGIYMLFKTIDFKDNFLYRTVILKVADKTINIYYIHMFLAAWIYNEFFNAWLQSCGSPLINLIRSLAILVLAYICGCILSRIPILKFIAK